MTFDFTDKTVFVTGAASGIGTTQAQAFLKAGALGRRGCLARRVGDLAKGR